MADTVTKSKKIKHNYTFTVGRRKSAIARTRLFKSGTGKITVNEKDYKAFFPTIVLQKIVEMPLDVTSKLKDFDFSVKVNGGGSHGQAQAVALGIARALEKVDADLRTLLKAHGLLSRDSRVKERKKPGLKRARRAPQFSKR